MIYNKMNVCISDKIKWYIYGYFLGDGNMRHVGNSYAVNFYSKDKHPIDSFAMYYEVPLKRYSSKDLYYISVRDEKVYKEYLDLGFRPRKSIDGYITPSVPEKYVWEFLRGLLDSDGTVIKHGNRHIELRWLVDKRNTDDIVKMFYDITPTVTICKDRTYNHIRITKDNDVRKMYDNMYYSECLCMERKRSRIEHWMDNKLWKYKFRFKGKEYKVRDQQEFADIVGCSKNIIHHFVKGEYARFNDEVPILLENKQFKEENSIEYFEGS